jgi:glucose-6-phosphate 1-epimerase
MTTADAVAALNARFSIPGIATLVAGEGGLIRLDITNRHASASLYLHGAHVARFQPVGAAPVLWMSASSLFAADKPIRGGVPICWPWFGAHPSDQAKPAHGFVRLCPWTLVEIAQTAEGRTIATLELVDDVATRQLWPHAFRLLYQVTVGPALELDLRVDNPGDAPIVFAEALHTYLGVDDIRRTQVLGLAGTDYLDKVRDLQRFSESGAVGFAGETDRVYLDTTATCTIADGSRRLVVAKEGSRTTVVWNPWIAKAKAMRDFGDDEWTGMVCVETVNAFTQQISLPPGATHHMVARVGVGA